MASKTPSAVEREKPWVNTAVSNATTGDPSLNAKATDSSTIMSHLPYAQFSIGTREQLWNFPLLSGYNTKNRVCFLYRSEEWAMISRRRLFTLVTAIVVLSSLSLARSAEELPSSVPSFSLPTVQGENFDLAGRKGQPLTAVIFFATWNPKSAAGLAAVQSVAAEFADKGLSAVALNAENEALPQGFDQELAKYLADHQVTLPVAV
ncbi:MAG TPA: TlpA disulfide reductase family protein, partial [Geobacteraceae bacterium]